MEYFASGSYIPVPRAVLLQTKFTEDVKIISL